jgi:methylmalonyl-CoA mutase, N-terminal domain
VTNVADPLGGAPYVEWTDRRDGTPGRGGLRPRSTSLGDGSILEGVIKGIDENWFQGRIADSAYELERTFNSGERVIVGVSGFTEGNDDDDLEILRISNADEDRQRKRLDTVRHDRDQDSGRCRTRPAPHRGCRPRSEPDARH